MRKRVIDGIVFYLYRVTRRKRIANIIATQIRARGHYARIIPSSRGYEIWVSANPRWFYKWVISDI